MQLILLENTHVENEKAHSRPKVTCVSAYLCVGKGADSLFYSDYSQAGSQGKKS